MTISQARGMRLIKLVGLWNKDLIFSCYSMQQIKNQIKLEDGFVFTQYLENINEHWAV